MVHRVCQVRIGHVKLGCGCMAWLRPGIVGMGRAVQGNDVEYRVVRGRACMGMGLTGPCVGMVGGVAWA